MLSADEMKSTKLQTLGANIWPGVDALSSKFKSSCHVMAHRG